MSIELLAPAGEKEAFLAAVKSGANAVYLGATLLNARAGAGNFDREALRWACDYAHERNVRVHVTVNTMVKENEMALVDDIAEQLAFSGADAAIVQDPGVARRLHALLPSLSLHASTQMALHNAQGAQFALNAGFSRAVLAREMNFEEMTECARTGIEIEVFAHGALCVACSGQCLFSSLIGGRSGNRGQCAQPCRLPYRLDGAVRGEGYLLSPKDLLSLEHLDKLRDAGVTSLKLEGRLKRPEYVAAVTKAYREALDLLDTYDEYHMEDETREELMQVFNRGGFTRGYAPGLNDRELMSHDAPNHQGVPVGRVSGPAHLQLTHDIDASDSLILRGKNTEPIPLRGISGQAGQTVRTRLPNGAKNGMALYRLTSQEQMERIHEELREEEKPVMLSGYFRAAPGEKALLQLTDGEHAVRAESDEPLQVATGKPADENRVRAQLIKTGGTPYDLLDLHLQVASDAFLPASLLNELRRNALSQLSEARIEETRGCEKRLKKTEYTALPAFDRPERITLNVQGSSWQVLCACQDAGAEEITLQPNDLSAKGLSDLRPDRPFALALPPVCSAESLDRLCDWAQNYEHLISAVYIANPGQLVVPWPGEKRADFALNLANREALAFYLEQGITRYTPSAELTAQEIRQLEEAGGLRELIVYGRLPLMQLRHCPIRAQQGGTHDACHRCDNLPPEEQMDAHGLIDRKNVRFPLSRLKSDEGCIVRLYNSAPLYLLRHVNRLPDCESWRLLLTDETQEEALTVIRLHREALSGAAVQDAGAENTTTGHYFRGVI